MPRRILVVDDNRDSADSLARLLELMGGHETAISYDGPSAVEKAEEYRPEVVLLDVGLPGIDGYEVCRRIRANEWGKSILLIAATGWGQPEDRRKSREAGFDHHLVKPIDLDELVKFLG
jgi:CheY-like chemotaxis protein